MYIMDVDRRLHCTTLTVIWGSSNICVDYIRIYSKNLSEEWLAIVLSWMSNLDNGSWMQLWQINKYKFQTHRLQCSLYRFWYASLVPGFIPFTTIIHCEPHWDMYIMDVDRRLHCTTLTVIWGSSNFCLGYIRIYSKNLSEEWLAIVLSWISNLDDGS